MVIVSCTKTAVAWIRIKLLKYSLGSASKLRPSKCETGFQYFLVVTFAVQQTRTEGLHFRPHITRRCRKSHSFYLNA